MPDTIPMMGLGTYGRLEEEGIRAILSALEIGYRHIDTAQSYGSEPSVGEAVRRSGLDRDEVFITTKVAQKKLDRAQFLPSVETSLKDLQVDVIDLVLIHWPSIDPDVPFESYMEDLGRIQDEGKARHIGVSNFPIARLKQAEEILGPGRIHTDQVEIHPFLQNNKLVDFALSKGITPTAYMPLAQGRVAEDPVLQEIAEKHDASASQISLAWLMQRGIAVIPASASAERQKSNFDAQKIVLSKSDMERIAALDRGFRIVVPEVGPDWD
ncbi:aldo/keto reductase [Martelella radicis]|uniref:2,5-diketo-D-gluconate reductase B n=1 Tax=Martelella radicis TaxID=1397476 RepID=A0A7W6PAV8_9HYPH|nr:aldo/keto reductase [Martelella radicis]MBB4123757.1 2,5-diketo-D-gluconate reductase B [Martelella radicis]